MGWEHCLYGLAFRALDNFGPALIQSESEVHLQGTRRRRNERASDEPHLQFHQPDEAMTTESGIADTRTSTPEEIAYSDEMITLVQFALRRATPQDREAFVLHALEGFSTDEIVAITDRRPDQLVESIRNATNKLPHPLPANDPFDGKRLQPTGTD